MHRNLDLNTCSLKMSSNKQSLATPVTTLGNPEVLASKPISSKDSKFVELNALTYRAANGTEVCPDSLDCLAERPCDCN